MMHQELEELELASGERDEAAAATDLARDGIQREVCHGERRRVPAGLAAQQRPDAGQELVEGERLCQVVVRSGVEAPHAVGDSLPGREHQDGRLHAPVAQRAAHGEPVARRQEHVQDDEVVGKRLRHLLTFGAVAHDLDHIAFFFETAAQRVGQLPLILDDQNHHTRHTGPTGPHSWRRVLAPRRRRARESSW